MSSVWRSRAWPLLGAAVAALSGLSGVAATPPAAAASAVTVSLTFTDGFATQYRYGRPVLLSHGVPGTFYVASNWASSNDAKYMRTYQLDDLYRDGNEIGGMGKDHKNLTTTYFTDPAEDLAYKQDQVCGDRQVLTSLGYDPQTFAYPAAAENAAAQSIVSGCGYRSGRVVGGLTTSGPSYAEAIPPANAFRLRTASLSTAPVTLQSLQNAVLAASNHGGGWLPLAFNQVCSQSDPAFSTCMGTVRPIEDTVLSAFLDWLRTSAPPGSTVRTVRDVMGAPPQPPLETRATVVSLTFDDGVASQYQMGDLLGSRGLVGTFYLSTGILQLTWPQVATLAAGGNEIGGHTVDHVDLTSTSMTFDEKLAQVCEDRRVLMNRGYAAPSFAYPFGSYDNDAISIAQQCGYKSARRAGGINPSVATYSEAIPPLNPFTVRTAYREPTTPLELSDLTTPVENARTHGGGWVPMVFHEICSPAEPAYQQCMQSYKAIDVRTMASFLDWLKAAPSDVMVKTVGEVMGGGREAPLVTINSPTPGQTVTRARPTFSGSADGAGSDVTVSLYQGKYATGTRLATLTATNNSGAWSVQPQDGLAGGTYTVQARQTVGGLAGLSPPVTFSVDPDTAGPTVSISAPAPGATTAATPTIQGAAGTAPGDAGTVSVAVYAGSTATGTPTQTLTGDVQSNGSWTVTPATLGDGDYTVQATQADDSGNVGTSNTVTFTVAAPPPGMVVSSVSPAVVSQGATNAALTVSGSGFVDGAQVSVSGSGVTVTGTTVTSETSLSITVDVAADASTGSRDLDVTAPGRTAGSCTACLTVSTAPSIAAPIPTSASPSSLGQGATAQTVTVTGSGFQAGATVQVSGSGVSATVRSVTATSVSLSVTVAADATTGARDLSVVNPDGGSGTCPGCFAVVAGPKVASVSPTALPRGRSTTVTVTGSGFDSTLKVSFSGSGITTSSFRLSSATTFTIVAKVTTKATLGGRAMTVTSTATKGTITLPNAVTVVN